MIITPEELLALAEAWEQEAKRDLALVGWPEGHMTGAVIACSCRTLERCASQLRQLCREEES